MSNYKNLLLAEADGVLTITVNREEKLNALNIETIAELRKAFQYVYDNKAVKAVILTGAGAKAFVAGADITEIAHLNEVNGRKFAESGSEVFAMIEESPKPVIALVNGFALGGGCELAMACHMRIATANAKFGQPEVNLGLIPGYGGTQRLTQLVGKGKALELLMTADAITAEEAKRLGLVNHVCEDRDSALATALEIINKIKTKAPLAIGIIVNCVNAVFDNEKNGYQTEANGFGNCCKSADFKEGTTAFLEKRKPVFKGE